MPEKALLVHISKVAEDLGLSQWQVRGMIRRGELTSEKVSNRTYVPAVSLDAYKGRVLAAVEDAQ